MRSGLAGVLAILGATVGTGCGRSPAPVAASPFLPAASIRELMQTQVDPAADALWDSVSVTITVAGEEDRQPRSEEEWNAVRRSALTLVEATNLLVMDGRRVVAANTKLPPGEPDPTVLQRRIDANPAAFAGFARAMRQVGLEALAAIDARDANKLLEVGGELDEACESCHIVYWYPPDLVKN